MNKRKNNKSIYFKRKNMSKKGYNSRKINKMIQNNELIKIRHGLYRKITNLEPENQSFVDLSIAIPKGVVCLISALAYYELTTFNPNAICIAIPHGSRINKIYYPPVEIHQFSLKQYKEGVERIKIGHHHINIYCREKTICDCFRYRNKIGLDIAKESLRNYLRNKNRNIKKILYFAEICRVKPIVETWLNALI